MDAYLALWAFIVAMVATPGPANMLLMTAGAQQGYVRTLPFIGGLLAGKLALNLALAFGLMQIIDANPDIKSVFVFVSAAYMAYLALRNWTPPPASSSQSSLFVLGRCDCASTQPKNLDDGHASAVAIC